MMTLPIGNRFNRKGVSFFELMVTIVVVSVGLLAIFRAFFLTVDYLSHLRLRLYALNTLDRQIREIQNNYNLMGEKAWEAKEFDNQLTELINLSRARREYQSAVDIFPLEALEGIYQVDLSLRWEERARNIKLSRSSYISNFSLLTKTNHDAVAE